MSNGIKVQHFADYPCLHWRHRMASKRFTCVYTFSSLCHSLYLLLKHSIFTLYVHSLSSMKRNFITFTAIPQESNKMTTCPTSGIRKLKALKFQSFLILHNVWTCLILFFWLFKCMKSVFYYILFTEFSFLRYESSIVDLAYIGVEFYIFQQVTQK